MNKPTIYFQNNRIEGKIFDIVPYPSLPIKRGLMLNKRKLPKEYDLLKTKNRILIIVLTFGFMALWSVAIIKDINFIFIIIVKKLLFPSS
jgi:hypothetical protein